MKQYEIRSLFLKKRNIKKLALYGIVFMMTLAAAFVMFKMKVEDTIVPYETYVANHDEEQFIRNLISGSNLRERPSEYWKEVVSQLSAIGNNINQIAHNTNITKNVNDTDMRETLSLMNDVWNIVKGI